jgi:hypothetical protein
MHTRSRLPELVGLAAVLGLGLSTIFRVHQERQARRARAEPEHIQTWEGEGGSVPVGTHHTAAEVAPAPSATRGRLPADE